MLLTQTQSHMIVLSLLVCKATSVPEIFNLTESVIIIQHGEHNHNEYRTNPVFVERYEELELECSVDVDVDVDVSYLVWRRLSGEAFGEYAFATFIGEKYLINESKTFEIDRRGSLRIHSVNVIHEGLYTCMYNTPVGDTASYYGVSVYGII